MRSSKLKSNSKFAFIEIHRITAPGSETKAVYFERINRVLEDPDRIKSENLKTDIYVPVRKV